MQHGGQIRLMRKTHECVDNAPTDETDDLTRHKRTNA